MLQVLNGWETDGVGRCGRVVAPFAVYDVRGKLPGADEYADPAGCRHNKESKMKKITTVLMALTLAAVNVKYTLLPDNQLFAVITALVAIAAGISVLFEMMDAADDELRDAKRRAARMAEDR